MKRIVNFVGLSVIALVSLATTFYIIGFIAGLCWGALAHGFRILS